MQVEFLLREWVRLYHQPAAGKESEKAFSTFVAMVSDILCSTPHDEYLGVLVSW